MSVDYYASIENVCPLDGRESEFNMNLRKKMSESGLHINRMKVMIENLIQITTTDFFRDLTETEINFLNNLKNNLNVEHAKRAAYFDHFCDKPLEHDVKACEYVLREILSETSLKDLLEAFYFPVTSEDINNIAYNLMIIDGINESWLPAVVKLLQKFLKLADQYKNVPCLALTHGQPASPTTMGKRFGEMASRMMDCLDNINKIKLSGKCNGPTGNDNAIVALSNNNNNNSNNFDYRDYAKHFVESFGMEYSSVTNQRNNHLSITRLFQGIQEMNTIIHDCADNIWHYIQQGWLEQVLVKHEVGSSVMPQKINPWRHEVSLGYAEISNSLITGLLNGLICSKYERDLSDHPHERSYGMIIGFSLTSIEYLSLGMDRVSVCNDKVYKDLMAHPEVLSEVVQIGGRILNQDNIYTKVKDQIRDKIPIDIIIRDTIPDSDIRNQLLDVKLESYIGNAPKIVDEILVRYQNNLNIYTNNICSSNNGKMLTVKPVVIIYDMDNTLIKTNEYVKSGIKQTCLKLKIDCPSDITIDNVLKDNLGFAEIFDRLFGHNGKNVLEKYRLFVSDNNLNVKIAATTFGPKTVSVFKEKNYYQAILTNRKNLIRERLEESGYNHDDFVWIGTAHVPKPNPDAFKSLPKWMNVSTHRIIYVGDHPDDWVASQNFERYVITTGSHSRQDFSSLSIPQNRILNSLSELYFFL